MPGPYPSMAHSSWRAFWILPIFDVHRFLTCPFSLFYAIRVKKGKKGGKKEKIRLEGRHIPEPLVKQKEKNTLTT